MYILYYWDGDTGPKLFLFALFLSRLFVSEWE